MADNVSITPGVGATVAADEIAGALHQRVKITVGADGTNDGDVSSANPLPVVGVVDLGANNDVTVTGTVTANLSATDNAVLDTIDAVLDTIKTDSAALVVDAAASEVLLGTIDADTGAIKTAVEALDNAVDGNYLNTNMNIAGTDVVGGAGAVAAGVQRVTLASDDPAVAKLTTIDTDTGAMVTDLAAIEVLLGTIDADTGAIKTAVEVIDNAISGSEMQVDVVAALPAGTNAIGKLAANSGVDIGDVDVLSLPALAAGTNNIGDVDVVSMASGKTILRAVISAASSGDNTLVAAVADKKIKVLSVCLVATAAVTVRFESGASGTALSGVISLDAKSGFILNAPADPNMYWFETGVNTLLNLELGGAVQVSGMMTYYTEA